MPDRQIIVDTGPLVALLVRDDAHHEWAERQLQELPPPLLTCEPVLAETAHLVRRLRDGGQRFFELLSSGLLTVEFRLLDERESLKRLMRKYASVPMSLADACLVRMSEVVPAAVVFTTDADFGVYRKERRRIIPTILPGGDA